MLNEDFGSDFSHENGDLYPEEVVDDLFKEENYDTFLDKSGAIFSSSEVISSDYVGLFDGNIFFLDGIEMYSYW